MRGSWTRGGAEPRRRRHLTGATLAVGVVLALLTGCPGDSTDPGPGAGSQPLAANATVQDSWMFRAAEDPTILEPFEMKDVTGQAWLGVYHNDLQAAYGGLSGRCTPSAVGLNERALVGYPCVGLARVHLEQATTFAIAAEVDRIARRQFYAHRADRPDEVLASVHEAYFAGVNLVHSGATVDGNALLSSYAESDGALPVLALLARRIVAGGSDPLVTRIWGDSPDYAPSDASFGELPASAETQVYVTRLKMMEAVAKGDLEGGLQALQAVARTQLDLQEKLEQKTETGETVQVVLSHFDSAFIRTLARLRALAAKEAIADAPALKLLDIEAELLLGRAPEFPAAAPSVIDGIAFVVFSGWPTPTDRLEALREGARPSVISRLGNADAGLIVSASAKVADPDAFVRLSNSVKDRLTTAIRAAGNSNMDIGMGLSERFLGRLLADGARDIQLGSDTSLDAVEGKDMATAGVAARSLLEMAVDKNPAPPSASLRKARISFRNDPPLLVSMARAELDTKRPYYANDYIRPLTEVYPELIPVREGLAALDSAWNPMRAGAVR